MARKKNAMEVKAAKQKKIAIGGFVLLLVVLGIQVPRTLKMMKGTSAAAPVAVTTPAPGAEGAPAPAPAEAVPGAPAAATPTLVAPTELTDSDPAPVAGPGQLVSFELFETKDPFAQQVDPNEVAAPPAGSSTPSETPPVNLPATSMPGGSGSGTVVPPGGSPAPTVLPPPTISPAATTSISVNGAAEDVQIAGTFPIVDPSFVLVSLGSDGKSVKIGVAGGSYADGKSAITLTMGKPLTLQNTASGARYELKLLTVLGSSARPK